MEKISKNFLIKSMRLDRHGKKIQMLTKLHLNTLNILGLFNAENKFYNGRNRSRDFYNTLTWPFLWVRYGSNTVLGSTNIAYLNSDFGF